MKIIYPVTPYIRVADTTRSLAFYVDGLGFEVVDSSEDATGVFWASLRLGEASLMVFKLALSVPRFLRASGGPLP